ncbi:hypothetical protein Tco_0451422 [Tanacetum coccineum]
MYSAASNPPPTTKPPPPPPEMVFSGEMVEGVGVGVGEMMVRWWKVLVDGSVMVAVTGDDIGVGTSAVVVVGFGYVCVCGGVCLTEMKKIGGDGRLSCVFGGGEQH